MKHRVFVYGTLKKGFPNHDRYMQAAEKLGNYRTVESFPLVLVGERFVPCMLDVPGEGRRIKGELFEVDDGCLQRLDVLEGTKEPYGYRRRMIKVKHIQAGNATTLAAHAYLISPKYARDRRSDYLSHYSLINSKKYSPRPNSEWKGNQKLPY